MTDERLAKLENAVRELWELNRRAALKGELDAV